MLNVHKHIKSVSIILFLLNTLSLCAITKEECKQEIISFVKEEYKAGLVSFIKNQFWSFLSGIKGFATCYVSQTVGIFTATIIEKKLHCSTNIGKFLGYHGGIFMGIAVDHYYLGGKNDTFFWYRKFGCFVATNLPNHMFNAIRWIAYIADRRYQHRLSNESLSDVSISQNKKQITPILETKSCAKT